MAARNLTIHHLYLQRVERSGSLYGKTRSQISQENEAAVIMNLGFLVANPVKRFPPERTIF
jgi:hypothetical protein